MGNSFKKIGTYVPTVLGIAIVLYVMGFISLILTTVNQRAQEFKHDIKIEVYLKVDLNDNEIVRIQKMLDAEPYVRETERIYPEKEAERWLNEGAFNNDNSSKTTEDLFQIYGGENFLPPSIVSYLKEGYTDENEILRIRKELMENPKITDIIYNKDHIEVINENAKSISNFFFIILGVLLFITFALINFTIRLDIYSKRLLIKSMQLVGATQSFVRKPFLTKSFLQGAIAGIIGVISIIVTIPYFLNGFPQFDEAIRQETVIFILALTFIAGVFLSWFSTIWAVRKYLKIKSTNLY